MMRVKSAVCELPTFEMRKKTTFASITTFNLQKIPEVTNILYLPLLAPALLCLPDYMHAVVSRDYLQSEGYSAQMVTLSGGGCKPTVTPWEVIFDIPYNGCGTIREVRSPPGGSELQDPL